jgi:hypothetical protein
VDHLSEKYQGVVVIDGADAPRLQKNWTLITE